jgi:NADH-quinone oxidoreductase subunit J
MAALSFNAVMFYVLASVGLVSGLMVITRQNAVHSALFLVGVFLSVAGVYVVLGAEFLAAVQLLVYAGGILVLFLFVIMLVKLERMPIPRRGRFLALVGTLLVLALVALMGQIVLEGGAGGTTGPLSPSPGEPGNLERIGMSLYRDYLLPFEVASVLLLVAMIGAIVLAREPY